jgi:hypothetical protein
MMLNATIQTLRVSITMLNTLIQTLWVSRMNVTCPHMNFAGIMHEVKCPLPPHLTFVGISQTKLLAAMTLALCLLQLLSSNRSFF